MKKGGITFIGVKGIPANFPGSGGIEYGTEKLATELVKMGYDISVFVRSWAIPKSIKDYKGIKLIHLPSIQTKYTDTLTHCFLASCYVCVSKHKIILYRAVGSAFFSFLPKLFGKKVVVSIHGADWERDKWGLLGKLFLRLCEQISLLASNEIIVVSKELQDRYQKKGIKTRLISNAFEHRVKCVPRIIKDKYGLKGNDYILYLGRFVHEKRLEWLIRGVQKLTYPWKLILAGGSSNTDSYVQMLKNIAASNSNIIFTDYVFGLEKEELLSNCRLFVQPSRLEGRSNALIDAVNYRQAILAADIPSNKEILDDDRFLFKSESFTDFCFKLEKLLGGKKIVYKAKKGLWECTWNKVALAYSRLF